MQKQMKQDLLKQGDLEGANAINIEEELEDDVFEAVSKRAWTDILLQLITKVVSLNSVHGEVYSIQHYVIKFVSDLRQVSDFFLVSSTNKTYSYDITEILLKVVFNTINLILYRRLLWFKRLV
jgi:Fe-S cluster biosynthesis and repair protein YggX